MENLTFYEPTPEQLAKFHHINSIEETDWALRCIFCDDCSVCDMAVHQWLLFTEKHTCTYGITEDEFRSLMTDADCEY